jgi:hypothetical protein
MARALLLERQSGYHRISRIEASCCGRMPMMEDPPT